MYVNNIALHPPNWFHCQRELDVRGEGSFDHTWDLVFKRVHLRYAFQNMKFVIANNSQFGDHGNYFTVLCKTDQL